MILHEGELHALRLAAERAWDDDTRHPAYRGHPSRCAGQCHVTSRWLADRLGGHVGIVDGHYVYIEPNGYDAVDLTGDRGSATVYESVLHPYFAGVRVIPDVHDERSRRFTARADRIFESPDLLKTADMIGDAYPGEEPQAVEDMNQRYLHDEPGAEPESQTYNFVYANGNLEVSPDHDHDQLAGHSGIAPDHTGPVAVGTIVVDQGQARFEVTGNIAGSALFRVLKEYCKHVGWEWGGLTDSDGWPINDEFAPTKKSRLYFAFSGIAADDLILSARLARVAGHGHRIVGYLEVDEVEQTASVHPTRLPTYFASLPKVIKNDMRHLGEAVLEWTTDEGLTLLAGDGNVIKTVEDLDQGNLYDPDPKQPDDIQYPARPVDERQPGGVYRCQHCDVIFPTWSMYQKHLQELEPMGDLPGRDPNQDADFPEVDDNSLMGDGAHFTEMRQEPGITTGGTKYPYVQMSTAHQARRVVGFDDHRDGDQYAVGYLYGCPIGYARLRDDRLADVHVVEERYRAPLVAKIVKVTDKAPADLIPGPIPFIYDIQEDRLAMGQPNTRTTQIPGQFTPGGIVEGTYEPGGQMFIRSQTNQPFSVRHLLELWYATNPMLELRSVHQRDDAGGDTKLAASVGGYVSALVAADPVASRAARALQKAGGEVYVVGGAVRDSIIGKEPDDIDLLVRGVPEPDVERILSSLRGTVDLTGKDFGVFRYREGGNEVEIAVPRRDRSTGPEHQDFEVTVDPGMDISDDLYRRDFTANAMAVSLKTGALIDPYDGARDIADGVLRTLSDASLSEDPLRVVRALVAHARHGLVPTPEVAQEMRRNASSLRHLPAERIQHELDKLFESAAPAAGIRLAHSTGVLSYLLPEVDDAFGFDQRNPHHELELGEHLVSVLERTASISEDPDVRLAALLHDIGKPASAWQDPDPTKGMHYYHNEELGLGQAHELVGADLARERLAVLKYPNDRIERITALVRWHMFAPFSSKKGARRFLAKVGEHADDLLDIRWGDQGSKTRIASASHEWTNEENLIAQVREAGEATDVSALALNGHDLIQAAGMTPGPQMGEVLRGLVAAVVDNPELNTREALLALAVAA